MAVNGRAVSDFLGLRDVLETPALKAKNVEGGSLGQPRWENHAQKRASDLILPTRFP